MAARTISKLWFLFLGFTFLVSLCLVPIHTKVAGVAWVSFLLISLFIILKEKAVKIAESNLSVLNNSALMWLSVAVLAYFIRLGIQIYHGEFNHASNFNLRVLLVAIAAFFMLKKLDVTLLKKYSLNHIRLSLLGVGFSAFLMAIPFKSHFSFGTNQIPWAAAITIIATVLQVCMLQRLYKVHYQIIGWLSLLLLGIAVLAYGVRGSYFYLLCLPGFAVSYAFFLGNKKSLVTVSSISLCLIMILLLIVYFLFPDVYQRGLFRIEKAYLEIIEFIHSPVASASSSVGARLYMWGSALQYIPEHPFLGFGLEGTKSLIALFADRSGSDTISGLNQLHNEYLQALVSYGIFGLVSFLLYPVGLLIIAFKLRKIHPAVCVGLLGMVFLFLTSSLTNTNTYHNYFGTVFSLSIGLVFIICRINELSLLKSSI